MPRQLLIGLWGAALVACGPGFDPPAPDSCSGAASAGIDGLELGSADSTAFTPLADGDAVELVRGGQGGQMIGVRFRLTGSDVPGCVTHSSSITMAGAAEQLASSSASLRTYAGASGISTTNTLWLVLFGPSPGHGDEVLIASRVAGVSISRTLRVDEGYPDAAPPPGELGDPCSCDGICSSLCVGELDCVYDLCLPACVGTGDTSCPDGYSCQPARNDQGGVLGYYCSPIDQADAGV